MTGPLRDGHIAVDDLGEPSPLPPELADELVGAEAAPPPVEPDPLEGDRVGFLERVIPAVYRLIGAVAGFRLPAPAQAAVSAVWRADPAETAEIALALAPMVPDSWVRSRVGRSLGIAGGLFLLGRSLASRALTTAAIRESAEVTHGHDHAGAEPAADAGARRAGPRPGNGDRPAPVEPDAGGAVPDVDGFTGAGLGLEPDR